MPLNPQVTLQAFDKWAIDFVGPINPLGKRTTSRYVITTIDNLTKWTEAKLVKDYSATTIMQFIFQNILKRFGCPRILMSDQGTHFLNQTIEALIEKFQVFHQKSTPYHPQDNGTVEAFNKFLEHALTKVCNINKDDWNLRIPTVLWDYRTTCKKLTGNTPFKLAYGKDVVMPMEYIVPSLGIAMLIDMENEETLSERLMHVVELEEGRFIARFHKQVQKKREKAWHDRHIKHKTFKEGDLIFLYYSKFVMFPGKFFMQWLGPYQVKYVTNGGVVQLVKLNGEVFPSLVNGSRLELYKDNPPTHLA